LPNILPAFAGPPPEAPQASPSYPLNRIARKKQQLENLHRGQKVKATDSKPETVLSKRFWREVSVKENEKGDLHILLDARPVRLATKEPLALPKTKRALATAIAIEWDSLVSSQQALKQHYIPLTSLTSRALDIQRADEQGLPLIREQLQQMLMRYLATDTLLCWAPETNIHDPLETQRNGGFSLRQSQQAAAKPIIAYLTTHIFPGVDIVPVLEGDSIMPTAQPQLTQEVIRGWIAGLPAFELAALERGLLATKSLLIATRLLVSYSSHWQDLRKKHSSGDRFGIEQAAEAANLEVAHQTQQWGEVEDTHDVDKEDVRKQLGSTILLVS
jgi:ATP synthase F1 complex assembly factor 2